MVKSRARHTGTAAADGRCDATRTVREVRHTTLEQRTHAAREIAAGLHAVLAAAGPVVGRSGVRRSAEVGVCTFGARR